jgi:AcrR family transcriptional regulator
MTQASETNSWNARGRPRDPGIDHAVVLATQIQLAASGYHRMSIDTIAAAAGTTKATIYKRWASKADLATAAVSALIEDEAPPNTGSAWGDLVSYLETFRNRIEHNRGMGIIGALLAEQTHTPELLDLFRERVLRPRRALIRRVLERARDRGEIKEDADLDIAVSMLIGSYYAEYITGRDISDGWIEQMITIFWSGIKS